MSQLPSEIPPRLADADADTKAAYEEFIAVKTNAYLPWTTTTWLVSQLFFMFTDYYIRHDPNRIYARVLPTILSTIVFWLWLKKTPPLQLRRLRRVWDLSVFLDAYWLSFLAYKTPAFVSTLGSVPMSVFCITFLSMYGNRQLFFIYITSLSLFVGLIVARYGIDGRLIELNATIVSMVVSLVFNQWRERLYFSEFSLKRQLEVSIQTLTATQARLIHTEKMAALGELIAGIAHEIQNPLNFVNNFSELSVEAVDELKEEWQKPARDQALEVELLTDIQDNCRKISHHGKRVSAIIKGMLDHSRIKDTGDYVETSINSLVKEYLHLAHQNALLTDTTFQVNLITQFATGLNPVRVAPQELSRVLLNLFSNAFYAVREHRKKQTTDYQPTVTVSTGQQNGHIEIRVADNGTGIAPTVKQKIFQPFFTTKPAGEGTGLGLSLSYDIVTKGHNGTLEAESQEGMGSVFIIRLPVAKGDVITPAFATHV